MRMPKCAGAPSHLIGKMHQRHAPSPAGRKLNRLLTDKDTSLPGRWLTGIRILAVNGRSPAWLEEIDIETGKRYRSIGDGGARSGHIETQVRWSGRRRTRRDRSSFNEVCLERIVIVGPVGVDGTGGSRWDRGCRGDASMSRGWLRKSTGTPCQ